MFRILYILNVMESSGWPWCSSRVDSLMEVRMKTNVIIIIIQRKIILHIHLLHSCHAGCFQ